MPANDNFDMLDLIDNQDPLYDDGRIFDEYEDGLYVRSFSQLDFD